ncbi:DUF2631 domain-containing protein [Corynebacterium sp. TAE3-ERU12]|uniref:DUF2631 domain-containing protein n=1 Tax=Corynebacterium sp. TAE3-ERU12 TaxID=2849491 RepID=UPI001C494696|nr:DUF2631 domain-containing protein [Corynebacterium sp. TAE3-ERU12]
MSQSHQKEEFYNGVSTLDEPSAKWGWHGLSKGAKQKFGWVSVVFLFLMLHGNHHGNVENIWLISLGVIFIIALLWHAFTPRGSQVRTVTARNKPLGHQEPEWCRDQVNGTGVYAELTDSQQRAWNRVASNNDPKHHELA